MPKHIYEYDCVDIYKQPAFDNVLLKNHKIQFAVFHTKLNKPGIYGARAVIDVYDPPVKMNQVSSAQIWVEGGPPAELNSIQFGWAVSHHFISTFMNNNADASQKTGCYNTMCPGFVQVHPSQHVGQPFENSSVIGGLICATQPLIYKKFLQDPETGNWWLFVDSSSKIGYWPKEILPHLSKAATFVQYGGWTYNSPDGLSPPMGTGRFPSKNIHESCFFAQLQTVNKFNNLVDIERDSLQKVVDNTSCYDAKHWGNRYGTLAQTFSFGGPGGMCGI
ncbi:hypothetical protein EZV62_019376 [Acer yangbiense]|uniref:Neprosin PEP catalytic domain-containing protein n=1 Tax=Acer yangbiense TaxID=1000413 RepID=A0A5C7HAR2_9ROSI|nr:hypothetical protein EZV62_019376 [Acer yangbiense]